MTEPTRLSHRAVATSALALVLAGASFAPAVAGGKDGKDGKDGNGRDRGRSEQAGPRGSDRRGERGERPSGGDNANRPAATPSPRDGGGQGSGGQGNGGQGGAGQGSGGAAQDPAGNNGTFKVDGPEFDDSLGNEPHVTCDFRLLFYGFDEGQTGDITIAGQAPSGSGTVSSRTGVLLSDDPAGGGPNDRDAIVSYSFSDLDLSGLTAHDKHGYHLKVTVATGEPGGVKHKVFWLEPCATGTTPTADVGGTGTENGETGENGELGAVGGTGAEVGAAGQENADRTAVLGTKFTRDERTGARRGAEVLGLGLSRGPVLAYTGSMTEMLLALGAGLLALGTGFLVWANRPRGRHAA